MSVLKVYSLKNCDTCKKALKWLDAQGVEYSNTDVRGDVLDTFEVNAIVAALGWEVALNRRSTTWRGLGDTEKDGIDNAKAVQLILDNPTLMKRPVFVKNDSFLAGFDAKAQEALASLI